MAVNESVRSSAFMIWALFFRPMYWPPGIADLIAKIEPFSGVYDNCRLFMISDTTVRQTLENPFPILGKMKINCSLS
ncbi:hypothetical protein MRB53_032275 [Persea americana]|uniref:Uncharacterized protein n=1 Tax=Persea americana TaxID=3435 RepID=A0ACC2KRE5_PERAE|nr:hypothetical protein MRB53_032275 [Persea americana]